MGLLKDTLTTSGARVVSLLLTVGIASASAWLLGPDGRGELAIYLVLGTLLMILTSSGVEMAGAYYAGSSKFKLSDILPVLFFSAIASLFISGFVAYIMWSYQAGFIQKVNGLGIFFMVLLVPMTLLSQSMQWLHSSLGDLQTYAIGQIINRGSCLLGLLSLCWYTRKAEYGILAYVIGGACAVSYMFFILVKKNNVFPFSFSLQCAKKIYFYGFRYFFARIAQFLNVQIATFVIAFLGTTVETGLFSASIGLVARLTILSEILNAVLLSRVLKQALTSVVLIAKAVRITFWATFFAGSLICIFSKQIVTIILSPDFLPAVPVILILVPGIIIRCCAKTLGVYFNGIGRPGINSIGIASAVITNVVLMYFLIVPFGIKGAAMAATCGYIVDAIILLFFYKFILKDSLILLVPKFSDITSVLVVFSRKKSETII